MHGNKQVYSRKILVQASHFNNEHVYTIYYKALEDYEAGRYMEAAKAFHDCLLRSHGHNFFVTVTGTSHRIADGTGLVMDDEMVSKVVDLLQNTNLSTLSYFVTRRTRVTIENLADYLARTFMGDTCSFPNLDYVNVRVEELPGVYAECEHSRKEVG